MKNRKQVKGKNSKLNSRVNNVNNIDGKKKEEKNIVITYSMLEQSNNNIMGIGKCLLIYVGIFPFIPLLISLFSCFVKIISNDIYTLAFICIAAAGIIIMFGYMAVWLINVMTVFIIDEENNLYRLRISAFWYKIKNKMYLLNPGGATGNRLMRMFYMINNIKIVLESVTEDITFDEFITMGKMERLSGISNVKVSGKTILFNAEITSKKGKRKGRIVLLRAFERDEKFCEYLKQYEKNGIKSVGNINFKEKLRAEDILLKKKEVTPLKKLISFTLIWTCIMAWICALTLGGDLSRLSKINAGKYVLKNASEISEFNDKEYDFQNSEKEEVYVSVNNEDDYFKASEYGRLYKPLLIIYISPIIVYSITKIADIVISNVKKE